MAEPAKKPDDDTEIVDDEIELEIIDDTPLEDQGRKVAAVPDEEPEEEEEERPESAEGEDDDEDVSEDEAKQYSDRVKKRISSLTAKMHQERRAKEKLAREIEELSGLSKRQLEEIDKLRDTVVRGESFWQTTNKGRLEAEIAQARRDYRDAFENGDPDKIAEAQDRLTTLRVELDRNNQYRPRPRQVQQPVHVQQPEPPPDEKALAWAARNRWFGKDDVMTYFAMGKHQELVNQGIDPSSDEYYKAIDKGIREKFPEAFPREKRNGSGQPSNSQAPGSVVVAPANRSGKTSRKVTLTASQVAIAKRLGITPKRYAEELLKQGNEDE